MSKKSYMLGVPTNLHTTRAVLGQVLASMRALQWQYWTAHWQVYGDPSYGDHRMFGGFYESMIEEIDTLAEKCVGYFGPSAVDPYEQIAQASEHMSRFKDIGCLHRRGLAGEEDLQVMLRTAYEVLKGAGTMTLGLDDFLMSVANAHETNTYLLQQRIRDPKGAPGVEREPINFELVGDVTKAASKLGFNKYNAPELLSQLLAVLKKEGLKDAENQIRMKKIPQIVEKAWSERDAADRLAATWFGRKATDSGAGSAEGHFFDNPERREVREFHDTGAVSNEPAAAAQAVENMEEVGLPADKSPAEAAQDAVDAPPTPAEIRELPGDAAVSTLNRYIIKTEEDAPGTPESRDEIPKHPEEGAKVGRTWRVIKED